LDKRLTQASHRCAPVAEVMRLTEQYRNRYSGWNARHFHTWYRKNGGTRSYTWVKSCLQEACMHNIFCETGKDTCWSTAMPGIKRFFCDHFALYRIGVACRMRGCKGARKT